MQATLTLAKQLSKANKAQIGFRSAGRLPNASPPPFSKVQTAMHALVSMCVQWALQQIRLE